MATLRFENINKIYDNNVQAVFDFNLNIKDKEFIVFVGPSGCGKSTTLRMVAGLEDITAGSLFIDDRLVNMVEPKDRGIAMVFQNYALYPHMTVYDNMAFSLKIRKFPVKVLDEEGNTIPVIDTQEIKRLKETINDCRYQIKVTPSKEEEILNYIAQCEEKIAYLQENPTAEKCVMKHMPKKEIDKRVQEAAKILGLTEYLKRKPAALSGGQRQRVALGRAIVRNPKVFLMDEPLSNLDAKLRVQMRAELTRIHDEVGATTIYVTHDQTEAMTMADRIVVMKAGYIQQIATPKEVYNKPANLFVATFIGSPSMNIINAEYSNETVKVGGVVIPLEKGFKKVHDEFYNSEIKTQKANVERLEGELADLSVSPKKNKKAIAQREEALNTAKKALEFATKALTAKSHEICFGIRPEDIAVKGESKSKKVSKPITVKATQTELLGQEIIVYSEVDGQKLLFKMPTEKEVKANEKVSVEFDLNKIHLFDFGTSKRLN